MRSERQFAELLRVAQMTKAQVRSVRHAGVVHHSSHFVEFYRQRADGIEPMHPDKKVGLALGILLIGITGAFFFRNEVSEKDDDAQVLADIDKIDQRIRHRSGSPSPYLPSRTADGDRSMDLANVPDSPIAGVIPMSPETSVSAPVPLPDPIRPIDEADSDRISPVPFPAADITGLDAAMARSGATSGRVEKTAAKSQPAGKQATTNSTSMPGSVQAGSTVGGLSQGALTEPTLYEVQPGDTLTRISERMLGTHRRFRELFEANRDILETPDDLRPGMKLRLPPDGETNSVAAVAAPVVDSPNKRAGATLSSQPLGSQTGGHDSATGQSNDGTASGSPAFVRPTKTPGVPGRRTTLKTNSKSSWRSLSQAAPPGVPIVRDFSIGEPSAVIATRPDDGSAGSTTSVKK